MSVRVWPLTALPGLVLALALVMGTLFGTSVSAGTIHLLTYDGPITPVAAEYLVKGMAAAANDGADAVIIQLDTPGGLDTSMREIIKAEFAAAIPVVVFVGPAGSRSASAGAFITLAAHVACMAPGTNIGSASPVQMGGGAMDSTMTKKVTNDASAYITSIAERRGRNMETSRAFVVEAVNLTAAEALEDNLIDFVAPTLDAVLDSLSGRTVDLGERSVTLAEDNVLVEKEMGSRQKLLKILADPNVAYILMLLGIYGLFFELSNPGAYAPGILGGICLLLALYAFQALPVNYTGIALILLGVIMLILEIKVPSYGALSIGGITALVLGSLMLFDSPEPWAQLSLGVLIPSVAVFAGFFLVCVWLAVRGQRRPVFSGPAALVGEQGRVVIPPAQEGQPGKVVIHGEMWNAVSEVNLAVGEQIEVTAIEGRVVQVVPLVPNPEVVESDANPEHS